MNSHDQGYIAIISLLIAVVIITFLLVRPSIFTGDKETKGTLETGMDAVEKAKQISSEASARNFETEE